MAHNPAELLRGLASLKDEEVERFISKIQMYVENSSPQDLEGFAMLLASTLVGTCGQQQSNNILATALLKVQPKQGKVRKNFQNINARKLIPNCSMRKTHASRKQFRSRWLILIAQTTHFSGRILPSKLFRTSQCYVALQFWPTCLYAAHHR